MLAGIRIVTTNRRYCKGSYSKVNKRDGAHPALGDIDAHYGRDMLEARCFSRMKIIFIPRKTGTTGVILIAGSIKTSGQDTAVEMLRPRPKEGRKEIQPRDRRVSTDSEAIKRLSVDKPVVAVPGSPQAHIRGEIARSLPTTEFEARQLHGGENTARARRLPILLMKKLPNWTVNNNMARWRIR